MIKIKSLSNSNSNSNRVRASIPFFLQFSWNNLSWSYWQPWLLAVFNWSENSLAMKGGSWHLFTCCAPLSSLFNSLSCFPTTLLLPWPTQRWKMLKDINFPIDFEICVKPLQSVASCQMWETTIYKGTLPKK